MHKDNWQKKKFFKSSNFLKTSKITSTVLYEYGFMKMPLKLIYE